MSVDYGIEARTSMSVPEMDIDSLPLDQLLQSEWFHQNFSQMLNISADNLTRILTNNGIGHFIPLNQTQRDPMPLLAILTTFYALIFVAGVLGNLITCIVISRNKFMHTATNFYLFNLAVSDLILLLSGMPQDLYNIWYPDSYPFTDVLCVLESVLSETAANATVLTITAFTVERYIAICHPFRQHTMSKLSRAVKFIFAIWIAAFLLALPQAMQFSVVLQGGGTSCSMNNDFFAHVFAVSGFIFFGGPMTAICVLYVLIGLKLKRSRLLQALPRRCYDVNRGISAQSRVIRMLVAVAVTFFLCWAPFHAQRLMAAYGSTSNIDSEVFNEIFRIVDYISGVLYFLSTCINPLLYNIMSHKFREAFKVTLARHFGLATKYQTQHHNYSALLRQNGSMRLHTTVNNNAFEHFNSYRVVHLQCRDPSNHLSLQDSIRTTTTTMNSASGGNTGSVVGGGAGTLAGAGGVAAGAGAGGNSGNNSCRSSTHRNRCVSIGSQSTLLTSLSKNDVYAATSRANGADHRLLQSQISQMSSVGDANSLLDADLCSHVPVAAYRLKDLGRTLARNRAAQQQRQQQLQEAQMSIHRHTKPSDCTSLHDNGNNDDGDGDECDEWLEHNNEKLCKRSLSNETEFTATRAVLMPAAGKQKSKRIATLTKTTKPKSYLDEYNDSSSSVSQSNQTTQLSQSSQPNRSRLKLSRIIINRRDQHAPKASENLADKFRWRRRKKKSSNTSRSKDNNATSSSQSQSQSQSQTQSQSSSSPTATTTALPAPNVLSTEILKRETMENIL